MKKASIVAIIASVVIIVAGMICCAAGSAAAKKEGYMLFPQTENGESVYSFDFTGHEVNRITVDANTSDVTLTTGGASSYIEVRNYNANYYRLNEENRAISFAEIEDVLSMFKFWEGFSFKGMRYVFSSGINNDKEHAIHVNIAESDNVSSIVLRIKEGTLKADGVKGDCDLTLSINNGVISVSSVEVSGSFVASVTSGSIDVNALKALNVNISTDDAETSVKDVECEKFAWNGAKRTFFADNVRSQDLSACATEASVTVSAASFNTAKLETESGPIRVDLPLKLTEYITDVSAQSGSIFLNSDKLEGSQYKSVPENTGSEGDAKKAPSIQIHTSNGSIDLNTAENENTADTDQQG